MDRSLAEYPEELRAIGIAEEQICCLASAIRDEFMALDAQNLKDKFPLYYPDASSISDQIIYNWTFAETHVKLLYSDDSVNQMGVLAANYLYFVYTQDTLLKAIKGFSPRKGPSRALSIFLTEGKVRRFRNAFSHGTWRYIDGKGTFKNIEYIDSGNSKTDVYILDTNTLQLWHLLSKTLIGIWIGRIADLRQPLTTETYP